MRCGTPPGRPRRAEAPPGSFREHPRARPADEGRHRGGAFGAKSARRGAREINGRGARREDPVRSTLSSRSASRAFHLEAYFDFNALGKCGSGARRARASRGRSDPPPRLGRRVDEPGRLGAIADRDSTASTRSPSRDRSPSSPSESGLWERVLRGDPEVRHGDRNARPGRAPSRPLRGSRWCAFPTSISRSRAGVHGRPHHEPDPLRGPREPLLRSGRTPEHGALRGDRARQAATPRARPRLRGAPPPRLEGHRVKWRDRLPALRPSIGVSTARQRRRREPGPPRRRGAFDRAKARGRNRVKAVPEA